MENAIKALYIVAGILVALMVAAMMVYLFRAGARVGENYELKQSEQQVELSNGKFLYYNRSNNTISDIVTVCNMAYNTNQETSNDTINKVEIEILIDGKIFQILATDATEKNKLQLKSTDKRVDIYSLMNLPLSEVKYDDSSTKLFESSDLNGKLTDTTILEGERQYRYYFQCTDVGYQNISGKINSMKFEMYENEDYPEDI